jgi:hypothetical protein
LADEDLLRPTLGGTRNVRALYSSTGFFVAAFFGGPLGAGVYGAINSQRLGRLRQDLPVSLALVASCFWLLVMANADGWLAGLADWLDDRPQRALQFALRIAGLFCFAAIYTMHRQYYRAAQVSGAPPLSGWIPGIVALVAGVLANIAFVGWLLKA